MKKSKTSKEIFVLPYDAGGRWQKNKKNKKESKSKKKETKQNERKNKEKKKDIISADKRDLSAEIAIRAARVKGWIARGWNRGVGRSQGRDGEEVVRMGGWFRETNHRSDIIDI